jgi:multidrug efflux pump subunit AcrA (membrane-fusion protein)
LKLDEKILQPSNGHVLSSKKGLEPKKNKPSAPPVVREQPVRHSEVMEDIISAPPNWLIRRGMSIIFIIIVMIAGMSAVIRFPDIIRVKLKIESPNYPKPIVAKVSGRLLTLLVKDNEYVQVGTSLAYMESTADHKQVIKLMTNLRVLLHKVYLGESIKNIHLNQEDGVELGELQTSYHTFFENYLLYRSSIEGGFYLESKSFLKKDLAFLKRQQEQFSEIKKIQQRDLNIAQTEYDMHKELMNKKVETSSEFRQQESRLLSKKYPLAQTESNFIASKNSYSSKEKEILELDDKIVEQKLKFLQSINSLISSCEEWKAKFILSSSQAGKVSYSGVLQENQFISANDEVFFINPENENFFGLINAPQNSFGKIKVGQEVLIKLKGFPYEEYGMIKGNVSYISDVIYKDSIFVSKVAFDTKNQPTLKKPVHLKPGMTADAEIITQDATILSRFYRLLSGVRLD